MIPPSEQLQIALDAEVPGKAVRSLVQNLADKGMPKEQIVHLLENGLLWLRETDRHSEKSEDALLDVLDALSGWCHPSAQLLPEPGTPRA